jgi:uncharacterized membrane protein YraQ (UPF0718 family)
MRGFSIFIILCLVVSFMADRKRTLSGLKRGGRMFLNVMPTLLTVMVLMAVALYLIPAPLIASVLGEQGGALGFLLAASIGSIVLLPGFIAYPLCSTLMKQGASVPVIAVFVTTLMMVGVLTLPMESKFFGFKAALLRNGLSLLGAVVVAILMGLSYGRI